MSSAATKPNRATTLRPQAVVVAFSIVGFGALTACGVLRVNAAPLSPEATKAAIEAVSGWTRTVATADYVVVVNVLPSERMMTRAEVNALHPTEGELVINTPGQPQGPETRHVEAHIYDRSTGIALTSVVPTIRVKNHATGDVVDVPSVLMQDVNIGPLDLHFGNNVRVVGDSDISVIVTVNGELVTVDGHLD